MLPKSILFNQITIKSKLTYLSAGIVFDCRFAHKIGLLLSAIELLKSLLFVIFQV